MTYETYIKDTAYGGYGVGTMPDGRVVFIPHTVEGDTVSYEVVDDKKNFTYGSLKEILTASDKRGEKYCPHLGVCGGCTFGHIAAEHQTAIKKNFVLHQLKKAGISHPEPAVLSADLKEFRNRATFRIRDGKIGFFKFKSNDFLPVDNCPVIKHGIVHKSKALAYGLKGNYELYVTENENGQALGRVDGNVDNIRDFAGLETENGIKGLRNILFDTKYGAFHAGFGTFLQGNRYLSGHLQDFVYDNTKGENALELYCGAGFLTLALARTCKKVTASEISRDSIALAKRMGLENVNWIASASEGLLFRLKERYDTILVDPPRTGLDKKVTDFIKNSGAKTVVYISCSPDTLARDLKRLSEKYSVAKLDIVDMFPGSYHVESCCLLKLNA
ncbi:class I SAM-dependent RNA methyltransferase [Seleniivibrio woodruffii]|uniref:23S rRNA (Uracil1939-C5)-methyltransferase n=1 Tax=Seleniivibrio woodruffii TaxID=1078050 RepID=A0A4R1KD12_9BACT|nr:methyltransferase [Seleniivibrio woodruffii]TCK62528.1 23S rRNA (uracil1939-C5)-methyltransferase [Seleniivibrio woodruffii]TVZ37045.1 23S rRNA (uracil1939-C5)-methyltransferase [Seleniivibrio woodruffii]